MKTETETQKYKNPTSWATVATDARVEKAWSELSSDDGYWVMLKTGFADPGDDPWQPTHTIHEWDIKSILRRMHDVQPCQCKDCKPV